MPKIKKSGHVVEYVSGKGYQYQHRIVAEKKLGRKLRSDEMVHHKDGNKQNNSPGNLTIITRGKHNKVDPELHNGGRKEGK